MARLSVDALGELTLKQVIIRENFKELRENYKEFELRTIAAMKRTKDFQDRMEARLQPLEEKLDQLLGQKRQLEKLLTRWAREIKDVELKDDVMRYLLGDIAATEVLSPGPIFDDNEESPDGIVPECGAMESFVRRALGYVPPTPIVEDQQSILPGTPFEPIPEEPEDFKSPSPPRRTLSCPGAPKRAKKTE